MWYKRSEKETQRLTTNKIFTKTHIVQQTKRQLRHEINSKIVYEIQGIGWNLLMMRISYKLTKRTNTENYLKIFENERYHKLQYHLL